MISIGDAAAEHRQTCTLSLVVVTYSVADVLDPLRESYPGPGSKPRKGNLRRVEWSAKNLALSAKAPVTGRDVNLLGEEIGRAVALEMFRSPLASMLLGLAGDRV